MVKLLILMVIVFILYKVERHQIRQGKSPSSYTKTLANLHIACGIIILIFGTIHGIGHLSTAPIGNFITGIAVLLVLYVQAIIGIVMKKNRAGSSLKTLKKVHAILPILLVVAILCHVLINIL